MVSKETVRAQALAAATESGGPMSALFAASHPNRVTSLVLYGTWARRRGLLITSGSTSLSSPSTPAASWACSRPASVSSTSVRPVCWPDFDHSVSPWRSSTKR